MAVTLIDVAIRCKFVYLQNYKQSNLNVSIRESYCCLDQKMEDTETKQKAS